MNNKMKKIDSVIALLTLCLWFAFLFTRSEVVRLFFSFGIGWTTTKLFLIGFLKEVKNEKC